MSPSEVANHTAEPAPRRLFPSGFIQKRASQARAIQGRDRGWGGAIRARLTTSPSALLQDLPEPAGAKAHPLVAVARR